METYDPDDEFPYVESDDEALPQSREVVVVSATEALALLDRVTKDLPGGGENRQAQRSMVETVANTFSSFQHAVVEAGTGVGKSLAYLVPSALLGKRVVVVTATKNLQDQLAQKDAPMVADHLPGVKVAILKGKQNYLCRHKATSAGGGNTFDFESNAPLPSNSVEQVRRLLAWSNETLTGDRDELSFEVLGTAWNSVSVSPQQCLHRSKCPQGSTCFHEVAKENAAEANIVVVNAALYASHLASGSMILPAHEYVVFDEAHELVDTLARALGTSLNAQRLRAVANLARPLLKNNGESECDRLFTTADHFATELDIQYAEGQLKGLSERSQSLLDEVTENVSIITELLRAIEPHTADDDQKKTQALGPTIHLLNDLVRMNKVKRDELLFLSKRDNTVTIEISLVDVGPFLREELWPKVSAVLTSATIPNSLVRNLGLEELASVESFASPFDYENNALLYVPSDFPERNSPEAEAAITAELIDLITAAGGRTLALFTNTSVMRRVAEAVSIEVETEVLIQGAMSRQRLIERFRDNPTSNLFAVASFWQGIDVPGHALSLVTIDRLPFSVPGDPLMEARKERSTNAFNEIELPRATMLLAQGVGRLIRSATDRGVVAVLDTRLATSNYRHQMFKKIPEMRRTRDKALVMDFLQEIDEAAS
jgi:ATP-dependent DNA helicase DinG